MWLNKVLKIIGICMMKVTTNHHLYFLFLQLAACTLDGIVHYFSEDR